LGNEFVGTYTGNGMNFGRPISVSDPIFYRVSAQ
jgi:hypothetical protein